MNYWTDNDIACSISYLQRCHSMALPQSTPHAESHRSSWQRSSSSAFTSLGLQSAGVCDVRYHNISMSSIGGKKAASGFGDLTCFSMALRHQGRYKTVRRRIQPLSSTPQRTTASTAHPWRSLGRTRPLWTPPCIPSLGICSCQGHRSSGLSQNTTTTCDPSPLWLS
jgi:hypothetical protein